MQETWGQWFRANFDKLLLFILYLALINLVLYMASNKVGVEHISWVKEGASGVMSGLLVTLTGRGREVPPDVSKKEEEKK